MELNQPYHIKVIDLTFHHDMGKPFEKDPSEVDIFGLYLGSKVIDGKRVIAICPFKADEDTEDANDVYQIPYGIIIKIKRLKDVRTSKRR